MESLRDKIIDAGLLRGLAATRNDEVFSFFVMAKRAALWPSSTYNLIPKGFFLEKIFLIGTMLSRRNKSDNPFARPLGTVNDNTF